MSLRHERDQTAFGARRLRGEPRPTRSAADAIRGRGDP